MNIIKKHIKRKIRETHPYFSVEVLQDIYEWVTESPITQWKTRLWCMRFIRFDSDGRFIEELNKMYDWITRKPHQ